MTITYPPVAKAVDSISLYCIFSPITLIAMLHRTPTTGPIPFLLVVLRF